MKADSPADAGEGRDGSRANKIQAACLHVRWKKRLVGLSEDFMRKNSWEVINRLYEKQSRAKYINKFYVESCLRQQ